MSIYDNIIDEFLSEKKHIADNANNNDKKESKKTNATSSIDYNEFKKLQNSVNSLIKSVNTVAKEIKYNNVSIKSDIEEKNKQEQIEDRKQVYRKLFETEKIPLSTKIINKKDLTATGKYTILNTKGKGILRELVIYCSVKFDLFLQVDKEDAFNFNSSYDNLSTISPYSDTATTQSTGSGYIVTIRRVSFSEHIKAHMSFDGSATIHNIFCVYDLGDVFDVGYLRDGNFRGKFAEGTATITNNNTSVVVTHGLSGTPSVVIPIPLDEQGINWYITNRNATTFTINIQAQAIGQADFLYFAKIS